MRYFRYAKLVRDKIIEHMKSNNQITYGVRILNDEDYIKELLKKVIEEAQELDNVTDMEDLKEELADVQEVLDYLKKLLGMTDEDVKKYQEKKILKNGGFNDKIYVDYVGVEEDNQWLDYYLKNPGKYPEIKNLKNNE